MASSGKGRIAAPLPWRPARFEPKTNTASVLAGLSEVDVSIVES
jgi:hypothetical protein